MPHHFEFDAKNKVLLGKLEGHITEEEFERFYFSGSLIIAKMNPLGAIADFSEVTRFDVRMEKLRSFAYATVRNPNRPRVVVAPNPAVFGLARMFQALSEETRPGLTVLHTLAEALEQLNLKTPQFELLGPIETE